MYLLQMGLESFYFLDRVINETVADDKNSSDNCLALGDFTFPLKPGLKLGFRPKSKLDSKIRF